MDWTYVAVAVVAALVASALVHFLLTGRIDRRLDALMAATQGPAGSLAADDASADDIDVSNAGAPPRHSANAERFAEIAPQLVALCRSATDSAIRNVEAQEWHRPSMDGLGSDDVSEAIRAKLRGAALNAVAARSVLNQAIRKNRASIPGELEAELRGFVNALNVEQAGLFTADEKRRLAARLDELEGRFRDALGADFGAGA